MSDIHSLIDQCPQVDREAIYAACRLVALADNRVWREAEKLGEIADRLQIPRGMRDKIRRKVKSSRCRIKIPSSNAGKRLLFEFAAQVAAADGKLTKREQEYARRIGQRLGLRSSEVEQRLARCVDSSAPGSAIAPGESQPGCDFDDGIATAPQPEPPSTFEGDLCGMRCGIKDAVDADRAKVFAHVRASAQYAARGSPDRLGRIPGTPISFILPWLLITGVFVMLGVGFAALPLFAGKLKPDDLRTTMFLGLAFAGLPGTLMAFLWWMQRRFDAGAVSSRAAVVVGQHAIDKYYEQVDGWSSSTEGLRVQSVTFKAEDGLTFQHNVRGNALANRLNIGDAGVLFLRRNWVVDFDCVLTGEQIRDGQMVGALVCGACETVYRIDDAPEFCQNCSAELPVPNRSRKKPLRRPYSRWTGWLDAWVDSFRDRDGYVIPQPSLKHRVEGRVTCGWCRCRYHSRPVSPNCQQCGGTLPMPPGGDPGPEPPAAPRRLPSVFVRGLFLKSRDILTTSIMFLVSLICCPFLVLTIPFFVMGATGLLHSLLKAFRRWFAMSRGVPVLGQIDFVEHFGKEFGAKENQKYRVCFRFEVDGELLQGVFETTDNAITKHYTGEPIWVVYLPNSPHVYATWPPFAS